MPLLMVIGSISALTVEEIEKIKKYIELGTILDVQFTDTDGETYIPLGYTAEVVGDDDSVTPATVTVVKNGSIVKADIVLGAPVIKGTTPFESSTEVTIEAEEGATIYYTTDGSTPNQDSSEYEDKITLSATTTVKAISVKDTYVSPVASKTFTKEAVVVETPVIAGETPFAESTEVTITAGDGASIYYTTNGDTPTAESTAYTEALTLSETTTVKAVAIKGGVSSEVSSKEFTKS